MGSRAVIEKAAPPHVECYNYEQYLHRLAPCSHNRLWVKPSKWGGTSFDNRVLLLSNRAFVRRRPSDWALPAWAAGCDMSCRATRMGGLRSSGLALLALTALLSLLRPSSAESKPVHVLAFGDSLTQGFTERVCCPYPYTLRLSELLAQRSAANHVPAPQVSAPHPRPPIAERITFRQEPVGACRRAAQLKAGQSVGVSNGRQC